MLKNQPHLKLSNTINVKRIYIFLLFLLSASSIAVHAQAPLKMSYQAIVRDASNVLVSNTTVGMKISILQGSVTGIPVYVETHTPATNVNGLATLEIGGGNAVTGSMSSINWGNSPYYIKTETDITGGTNYTISGTSELLSVPYALYAESVNANSTTVSANGGQGKMIVVYTTSSASAFYQNAGSGGTWTSTPLSGTPLGAASATDMVVVYTSSSATAFYQNSGSGGTWTSTPLSGTPVGAVSSNNVIVIYTANSAHAFYQNNGSGGTWTSTPVSGTIIGAQASADNIVIYTSTSVLAFYQNAGAGGTWTSTPLSGTPLGIINGK